MTQVTFIAWSHLTWAGPFLAPATSLQGPPLPAGKGLPFNLKAIITVESKASSIVRIWQRSPL